MQELEKLQDKISAKLKNCYAKYGMYTSFHEAMSVFREEYEELWDECKKKELDFENVEKEIIDCLVVLYKMHKDIVIKENRR